MISRLNPSDFFIIPFLLTLFEVAFFTQQIIQFVGSITHEPEERERAKGKEEDEAAAAVKKVLSTCLVDRRGNFLPTDAVVSTRALPEHNERKANHEIFVYPRCEHAARKMIERSGEYVRGSRCDLMINTKI